MEMEIEMEMEMDMVYHPPPLLTSSLHQWKPNQTKPYSSLYVLAPTKGTGPLSLSFSFCFFRFLLDE